MSGFFIKTSSQELAGCSPKQLLVGGAGSALWNTARFSPTDDAKRKPSKAKELPHRCIGVTFAFTFSTRADDEASWRLLHQGDRGLTDLSNGCCLAAMIKNGAKLKSLSLRIKRCWVLFLVFCKTTHAWNPWKR